MPSSGIKARKRAIASSSGADRDFGEGVEPLGHRGKGEEAAAAVEVERPMAEEVAGREARRWPVAVPPGEGEIAAQPVDRFLPPSFERAQDDRAVGEPRRLVRVGAEVGAEIGAVVEPRIGDEQRTSVGAADRTAVELVLGQEPEQPPAHGNVAGRPRDWGVGRRRPAEP